MTGFLCAIPVISGLIGGCMADKPLATGYVEGEYVLAAPIEAARLESLPVKLGDRVDKGATLAVMEKQDAEIAVAQARAALAQAESQLANLLQGRRPEEMAVIEASLNSARAQAGEAERVVKRARDLNQRGIAPRSDLDDAMTAQEVANAKVKEIEANLAVAKLPARPDEIKAAEGARDQARAGLDNATWRLENRTIYAQSAGRIADIIRNPGEVAGPSAPVLSLLPEGAVKLKVFVPEEALAQVQPGTVFSVSCDGCGAGETATVTYVSQDPEFTPPVIYSLENRQKLVFLVEARPDDGARLLKPGQIVDVTLKDAAR